MIETETICNHFRQNHLWGAWAGSSGSLYFRCIIGGGHSAAPIAARTCRLTDLRALRTNRRGRPPEIGDRAIFTLAPIAGVNRRPKVNRPPEAELWRKFEIARPLILGALLDATCRSVICRLNRGKGWAGTSFLSKKCLLTL